MIGHCNGRSPADTKKAPCLLSNMRVRIRQTDVKMASLILGTKRHPLWLLRSRPDQVSRALMRGDPPSWALYLSLHRLSTV